MINLESIIKTITTRISPLKTSPDKCCNIRSSRSNCSLCQDICPQNAVEVDKKSKEILFNNDCVECGICTTACPTGAISRQEPTELNLYNKIRTIGESEGTIVLSCQQNRKVPSKAIKLSCLGSLSLEFIFALSMLSFPIHVVYKEEACNTCSRKNGLENYLKQLEEVQKFHGQVLMEGESFNIKNHEESPKILQPKDNGDKVDLERRRFFGAVAEEARQAPKAVLGELLGTSSEKKKTLNQMPKRKTSRLKLLEKGLEEVKGLDKLNTTNNPYMSPKLVNDCYLCKACTTLCPVGAIEYKEGKGIFLNKGYCTGCGLCEDVCFYESIKLSPRNLKEIKENKIKELVEENKKNCAGCNKSITVSNFTENCFSCKKKISKNEKII